MDRAELEILDPFDLLDEEAARLDRFLRSFDDWSRPTRCAGWTARDLLSHLAGVEQYNRACLEDELVELFDEAGVKGPGELHDFNDWQVRLYGEFPVADLVEHWREANAAFRAEMRRRGRGGSMATSVGPYPVWLQAFHLAMEYATHADDLGVPVEPAEEPHRTAWRARFARFAIAELERPVEVDETPAGHLARAGDDTAELTDGELVEASQGRLPDDHPLPPALREALTTVP